MNSSLYFWLNEIRGPFDVFEAPRVEFLVGDDEKSKVKVSISEGKLFLSLSVENSKQSKVPLKIESMGLWGWRQVKGAQGVNPSLLELSLHRTYRLSGSDLSGPLIFRAAKRKVGWEISAVKTEKLKRDLIWGFTFLILVGLILGLGLNQSFFKNESQVDTLTDSEEPVVEVVESAPEISGETAGIIVSLAEQAFRGKRSYDESATVTDKVTDDLSKIQNLASQLSNLSQKISSGPGVKVKEGNPSEAAAKGLQALSKATAEVKGQLEKTKSGRVNSAKVNINLQGSGRGFSSEDELKIRKLFDSQNARMTQVFDRALKVDGTLSVTVNWQAVVQKDGRLGEIKFKSTGSYTDEGIKVLEQGLRDILGGLRLDPKAQGILLKGERFFAQ